MQFKDIPENNEQKQQFAYMVKHGRISHAQLLWGPTGSAALTMSLALAAYLQCLNKKIQQNDSCGTCKSCLQIAKLCHPDVRFTFPIQVNATASNAKEVNSNYFLKSWHPFLMNNPYATIENWAQQLELDPKQLSIPKSEIHALRQYVAMKPFEKNAYKIIFIWLPEYMHPSAANALLKLLEAPPERNIFLLVSHSPDDLLGTVRSRLQQIYFPAFKDETVCQYLLSKQSLDPDKLSTIVNLAAGNLHKANELLLHLTDELFSPFKDWMRSCYLKDFASITNQAEKFNGAPRNYQKHFLSYAIEMIRSALFFNMHIKQFAKVNHEAQSFATNLGKTLDYQSIKCVYRLLAETHFLLDRNLNAKIMFLDLSCKFIAIFQKVRQNKESI